MNSSAILRPALGQLLALFAILLLVTASPAQSTVLPGAADAEDSSAQSPDGTSLPVDSTASTESDTIATDDGVATLEDVTLPTSFQVPGTRSYTLDRLGASVYFQTAQTLAADTWWDGVCTDGESRYTTVRDYPREKAHPRMERTYARMYCGKKDRDSAEPLSEAAFGIRHIRAYHKSQFAKLASWQGSTWGNWMHWALRWVMSEPSWRTVQNADRFCYEKPFVFVNPIGDEVTRYVIAILGKTGVRIMTSFPRKKDYCTGTRF